MTIALAAPYHDPEGRLYRQVEATLPVLARVFGSLAIRASYNAYAPSLDLFARAGALLAHGSPDQAVERFKLGQARRDSIALALKLDCDYILYCDCDRMLHWAEHYPDELARVAQQVTEHDFTVIGRTPRAFDSHPRIQRDTEAIVNRVFASVNGHAWDVTAATRGLSRRAAQVILAGCPDVEVSTDVSWTLFLQNAGGFSLGYMEADGMEFETADRYQDQVQAAGGLSQWLAQLDADPAKWAHRLDMARVEIEGMLPYLERQL